MRAWRSLDSAVGQHPMTSSPLARKSSWKSALGRRNDGDGLPATKCVSDVPFYCHLPCGWLRLSTKTRFLCPGFRRGARGRVVRRGIPAPPTPTAGAWLRKVALLCGRRPDDGDVAWGGGGCDESAASPLIISIFPSLNRRPSPGSRREWVCERRGAETARSGGV